jgi:hypothetical protein
MWWAGQALALQALTPHAKSDHLHHASRVHGVL